MLPEEKKDQEVDTTSDKTELHELSFAEVLEHRRQVKAAIGTANLVTGDHVKATKVKASKAKL